MSTVVGRQVHMPVGCTMVDKMAYRKKHTVVVVVGQQLSVAVAVEHIESYTLVDKLEHKNFEHKMVSKLAYTGKNTVVVVVAGQR